MTALGLFTHLQTSGFTLLADGSTLLITPASKLSSDDRAQIKQYKPEFLRLLTPKLCERCAAPMTHIEAGYFSCPECHYQCVEAKSGFWYTLPMLVEENEERANDE